MQKLRWCFSLAVLMAMPAAYATDCPDAKTLDRITAMGSVFIGEMHGTVETPAFVQCVVQHDVEKGIHPTVAIEQMSSSRDVASDDWRGDDGRHSRAMAQFVQWLEAEEKAGKLAIHFMDDATKSGATRDRDIGESLAPLVTKGVVVAYAGNIHAQKLQVMIPALGKPAGEYVGGMTHIAVEASQPGTMWGTINGKTGVQQLPAGAKRMPPGTLAKPADIGSEGLAGYDYVYAVKSFTASSPALPSPAAN